MKFFGNSKFSKCHFLELGEAEYQSEDSSFVRFVYLDLSINSIVFCDFFHNVQNENLYEFFWKFKIS